MRVSSRSSSAGAGVGAAAAGAVAAVLRRRVRPVLRRRVRPEGSAVPAVLPASPARVARAVPRVRAEPAGRRRGAGEGRAEPRPAREPQELREPQGDRRCGCRSLRGRRRLGDPGDVGDHAGVLHGGRVAPGDRRRISGRGRLRGLCGCRCGCGMRRRSESRHRRRRKALERRCRQERWRLGHRCLLDDGFRCGHPGVEHQRRRDLVMPSLEAARAVEQRAEVADDDGSGEGRR